MESYNIHQKFVSIPPYIMNSQLQWLRSPPANKNYPYAIMRRKKKAETSAVNILEIARSWPVGMRPIGSLLRNNARHATHALFVTDLFHWLFLPVVPLHAKPISKSIKRSMSWSMTFFSGGGRRQIKQYINRSTSCSITFR